ncbi:hypothetical protein [Paenibacillus aceris]|uniref:HNH endonuclease n=1 Tax=Paenibacillus aceris TaxID=869555 RepID=A0ABS4I7D4_9BACL|nr:hypothetical protein [Paenibacillus aceris]MBP1966431.1 hypothetical protein [Paenibacillus aceris]NHW39587.1 hypothetical protein [Paenibacillus aceris]
MKSKVKNRTRAYYRHHRKRVIYRKSKIAKRIGWFEDCVGKFAKGKVHCSCHYCREKTWDLGFSKSDLVRLERMKDLDGLE